MTSSAVEAEVDSLHAEYEWILCEEVHNVLRELHSILLEACRRFPVQISPGEENLVKPEKFVLSSTNGGQQVRCMVTLMADSICEAELTVKVNKQQSQIQTRLYPDAPWRLSQVRDAGNHLLQSLWHIESRDEDHVFSSAQEILFFLDAVMINLIQGRSCLALPRKRCLEEIVKNPLMKGFKPQLPNDVVASFYVQAQKLVLSVYHLYLNPAGKIDIGSTTQVECGVPWLNDTLVLFTLALQQCQQLKDKVTVFLQYEAETKFTIRPEKLLCHKNVSSQIKSSSSDKPLIDLGGETINFDEPVPCKPNIPLIQFSIDGEDPI